MKMITIAFLLMLVLFIAAGATQLWVLAMIGGGIFLITLLMYLMATNDVLNAIAVGIVSGLASTGVNQVHKQLTQR